MITTKTMLALSICKEAHRSIDQKRRDGVRPYEVHPIAVAGRVARVIEDEDMIAAAFLHDVIEDVFTDNPFYDIPYLAAQVGDKAAKYVIELTDVYTKEAWPDLNRKRRKQLERERYFQMSIGAKIVKLADVGENSSDMDPADPGFAYLYLKEKEQCLPYLNHFSAKPSPESVALSVLWNEAYETIQRQKKAFDIR